MRLMILFAIAILTAGCAGSYNNSTLKAADTKLDQSKPVTIITPENGQYSETTYFESGLETAHSIKNSFIEFTDEVYTKKHCDIRDCFSDIKQKTGYMVYPEIIHWEDRATEWSGIRDKVSIKIIIYDISSKSKIASTVISGESSNFTLGGDHPQDLIGKPIHKYVSSLYK